MPLRRTEDAVHVVMTDHYIQRRKPQRDLVAAQSETADPVYRGEVVPYYPDKGAEELYVAVAQVRDGANPEGGIPRLREAIELLKPQQPEFYLELARAFSRSGNLTEAVYWCEEALRIRPGFVPAQMELGAALLAAGNFTRAAAALRGLSGPPAQTNLANAYLRLGSIDLAEQALRALGDDPDANNVLPFPAVNRATALTDPFEKRTEVRPDRNNWGPRFGFSYAPRGRFFGENKTVIRGGAAMSTSPPEGRCATILRRRTTSARPSRPNPPTRRLTTASGCCCSQPELSIAPKRKSRRPSGSSPVLRKRTATSPTFWPRKAAPAKRPPSTSSRRKAGGNEHSRKDGGTRQRHRQIRAIDARDLAGRRGN